MKLNPSSVLCLLLLLFHTPFLFAKKGGIGGKGGFGFKKNPTSHRGNTHTNTGNKNTGSHSGYPKQPGQNNQGGYPSQSGGAGQGNYPRQHGGSFHNPYPGRGSPYGAGAYGGGYYNPNPNNRIMSPHYSGSFGNAAYGSRGGSPFAQSVQGMGIHPNAQSKTFGRTAVMAAAGGAMAGMALGYGLGRFPRPNFHSPREEYYYNHYMHRKHDSESSDSSDHHRKQYRYMPTPVTYESYMDSCMKRTDLLPADSQKPVKKPAASTTTPTETTKTNVVASASDNKTEINMTNINSSAVENSLSPSPSPPRNSSQPKAASMPPASQDTSAAEDDDTVSIVEIGYPALIEQVKVRRCLELYLVYSEKYMRKQTGGAQGLNVGFQGALATVLSTILMLVNSNMLMPLH
ncbi:major prion protein homolog [Cololabis saira]|uniref:major prion protein homolog n=1 Tax=Cololabis saira TaxID=129043 RepID=UPI002AD4D5C8|nr:major prion protein homolog [Cololabis saira]